MPVFSKQDILHGKYTYAKNQEMPTKKTMAMKDYRPPFLNMMTTG